MTASQGRRREYSTGNSRGGQRTRSEYVDGNTVRALYAVPDQEERPARHLSNHTRKNRERAVYMNLGYVLFLSAALVFAGAILVSYIQLQSDITNKVKNISSLESQYNDLKLANDEKYNQINSSIDLEEIKKIAIGELGMTYPSNDQVVTVQGKKDDYVRQMSDIPDGK